MNNEKAESEGESEIIYMGKQFNYISHSMITTHTDDKQLEKLRALFPIGSYGNWCGKGHNSKIFY